MKLIDGTYCPLCPAGTQLAEGVYDGKRWAFCPNGATGPEDAHTAYVIGVEEVGVDVAHGEDITAVSVRMPRGRPRKSEVTEGEE